MKRQIKILTAVAFSFGLGFGIANMAMSDTPTANSIAVVNLDKVLSSSAQVLAVKKDQQKKSEELKIWLKNAQADVDKQQSVDGKKAKKQKYEDELAKKKLANSKDVTQSLTDIDKNVSNTISQYAKSKGYSIVISKNVVLYGGDDITSDLMKAVQ